MQLCSICTCIFDKSIVDIVCCKISEKYCVHLQWCYYILIQIYVCVYSVCVCSCGSVVEHCVSSAKVVSSIPREHSY